MLAVDRLCLRVGCFPRYFRLVLSVVCLSGPGKEQVAETVQIVNDYRANFFQTRQGDHFPLRPAAHAPGDVQAGAPFRSAGQDEIPQGGTGSVDSSIQLSRRSTSASSMGTNEGRTVFPGVVANSAPIANN